MWGDEVPHASPKQRGSGGAGVPDLRPAATLAETARLAGQEVRIERLLQGVGRRGRELMIRQAGLQAGAGPRVRVGRLEGALRMALQARAGGQVIAEALAMRSVVLDWPPDSLAPIAMPLSPG